jgi:creatinine amidohydrolase
VSASLFWEQSRAALAERAPDALVVVPVGAVEQHGPHLPVGTDSMVVEEVARRAAEHVAPAVPTLVTPTLRFGSSHHHLPWAGALSLSSEAFLRAVGDLLGSLARTGFRTVFILNGHGGNDELLQVAARDAALAHELHVAAASYWTLAFAGDPWIPGHAGMFETSLVLALRPELVAAPPEREAGPPDATAYRLELHGWWQETDGFSDNPAAASAEAGRDYLERAVTATASAFADFYRRSR